MNRTCHMKHFCEREIFLRRNAYEAGKGKEFKYEVWDPYASLRHDWDSPDTTEECVLQTDSKDEAQAFITQGAQRCELRENGICKVCDMYDKRQTDMSEGKVRPFYLVVSSTSRHYGGPEEGGWWYDRTEVVEVRKAFTLEQGLFHARKLRENYPQPKYNRFSMANRGEGDTRIHLCYGEDDPRWPTESKERPRYE